MLRRSPRFKGAPRWGDEWRDVEHVLLAVILAFGLAWGIRALNEHVNTLRRARGLVHEYRQGDGRARAQLERRAAAKRELRARMRPDSATRWVVPLLMLAALLLILWRG